jgi:hypothetical protein
MIRAHQPGSQPIDIPEVVPNPAVVPKEEPVPKESAPKEPVKVPEKVNHARDFSRRSPSICRLARRRTRERPSPSWSGSPRWPRPWPSRSDRARCCDQISR